MRDATDLEEIRLDLLAVAHQTLEPAHVLLWLPGSGTSASTEIDEGSSLLITRSTGLDAHRRLTVTVGL
jgi:hypothetical protein